MNFSRPAVQDSPQSTTRLTGWAALEEHERKREERTVWDYKEDMDSLLVFAGLYSAVLIGLLVESFQNLQADPQQETVQLLRQISAQTNSYTITSSHINSTVPFSDPTATPFEAHASDILVNVCWFASLILSLAAASFAILVKQWLKEYLAIEQTNPEERLRIRYFRKGGLETWKLFEIAAVLPLILQLALTLFFVGLCVFTSLVHASIGTTCICLVGGWAAFFGFALLAPILSPHCPYKTTFLKRVLSTIRIYSLPTMKYALEIIHAFLSHMRARLSFTSRQSISNAGLVAHRSLSYLWACAGNIAQPFIRSAAHMSCATARRVLRANEGDSDVNSQPPREAPNNTDEVPPSLPLSPPPVFLPGLWEEENIAEEYIVSSFPWGNERDASTSSVARSGPAEAARMVSRVRRAVELLVAAGRCAARIFVPSQASREHFRQIKNDVYKHEESQICRTNEKDTMIATGIDEMLNDELLVPMELALRQTCPLLQDVVQFAMNSVERRLNVQNLRDQIQIASLYNLPGLTELLDATHISMINIVADRLNKAVDQVKKWNELITEGDREHAELAWRFLVVLINGWRQSMPGRVLELMRSLASRDMFAGCKHIPSTTGEDAYGLSKVLFNIYDVLCSLDAIPATSILTVFFQCYFWKGDPQDTRISRSLLKERLEWSDLFDDVPCGSLIAVVELALTAVDVARWREDPTWTPGEVDLVGFVLDAIPVIFETRAGHDFDQKTIPGGYQSPLDTLSSIYRPDNLPRFLDCILARSDVLSAGKPCDLLLTAVTHWDLSLNPWKQYIQAKCESESPLSLISSLLLCRMVCHRIDWDVDNLVLDWHAICKDLVFLIGQALTPTSSNLAESGEGGHSDLTKEHEIALDILRDLDNPDRDSIDDYRDRAASASPRDPDHLQSEDEQYSRWRDQFDVDKSWYTDGLILRLLSIAGTDTVVDEDGFELWRVRRLKDIRDQQDKAVESAELEAEGAVETLRTPSVEEEGSARLKVSVPSDRSALCLVSDLHNPPMDVALSLKHKDDDKGMQVDGHLEGDMGRVRSRHMLTHN